MQPPEPEAEPNPNPNPNQVELEYNTFVRNEVALKLDDKVSAQGQP